MKANAPTVQKTSRTDPETSQNATIHFVCRECCEEKLVNGGGIAGALAREHEQKTGHKTAYGVVEE